MEKTTKRFAVTFILIVALIFGMTTSAFADTTGSTTATVEFSKDEAQNKLELVTAPAFSFGSQTLPSGGVTIQAESINGTLRTMDTTGNYAGWNVTALMTDFSTSTVENSMPGATITLSNGSASRVGSGASSAPTVTTPIELEAGSDDATPIVSAALNAGIGTWDTSWTNSNASLKLLDTPAVGQNTATITWTLVAGPTGS